MKISDKHKQFCKELLKHRFNQTKAYQAVYKGVSSHTARVNASVLLTKTSVKSYLENLKDKEGIKDLVTVDEIVSGIKEVLEYSLEPDKDGNINETSAMRALEMLGKYKAMFTDKTVNENTNINKEPIKIEFE
jgi:phage terminase small subunit